MELEMTISILDHISVGYKTNWIIYFYILWFDTLDFIACCCVTHWTYKILYLECNKKFWQG